MACLGPAEIAHPCAAERNTIASQYDPKYSAVIQNRYHTV